MYPPTTPKMLKKTIFAIKDNGIGIDKNHLEKIFTIFQRLHSREEYDGTGIGLAISQRILQNTMEKYGLNPNWEKEQHSSSPYLIEITKNKQREQKGSIKKPVCAIHIGISQVI